MSKGNSDSLSHPRWNCSHHIVFAPDFRRQNIYVKLKIDMGKIVLSLCDNRKVYLLDGWNRKPETGQ